MEKYSEREMPRGYEARHTLWWQFKANFAKLKVPRISWTTTKQKKRHTGTKTLEFKNGCIGLYSLDIHMI